MNNALSNMRELISSAVINEQIINIATDDGNAVLISEEEYRGILATNQISSNPNFMRSILDAGKSGVFIDESEVEW
jgi:PHD/YefM family antitoxin component YafN of YafNO toxin-antitoxin module